MNRVNIAQAPLPGYGSQYTPDPFNATFAKAQAAGDIRANLKNFDRAGMSRGAGQRQQAGIQAASSLADGIADAYTQQAQDATASATAGLAAEQGQEQFAQALGALQQQNAYANAMAALQRSGALMGLLR
jgi:hypothetical protein